jgi:hypothetical protein
MNDIHYLDTRCGNPVENDVVWMRHDFTHARYSLAWLEKVGMLCRMLKIVLNPIKKAFCGLLVCSLMAFRISNKSASADAFHSTSSTDFLLGIKQCAGFGHYLIVRNIRARVIKTSLYLGF